MNKKKRKKIKLYASIITVVLIGIFSFTNETIDYFGKLGINLSPSQSTLAVTFLSFIALSWFLWEGVFNK